MTFEQLKNWTTYRHFTYRNTESFNNIEDMNIKIGKKLIKKKKKKKYNGFIESRKIRKDLYLLTYYSSINTHYTRGNIEGNSIKLKREPFSYPLVAGVMISSKGYLDIFGVKRAVSSFTRDILTILKKQYFMKIEKHNVPINKIRLLIKDTINMHYFMIIDKRGNIQIIKDIPKILSNNSLLISKNIIYFVGSIKIKGNIIQYFSSPLKNKSVIILPKGNSLDIPEILIFLEKYIHGGK